MTTTETEPMKLRVTGLEDEPFETTDEEMLRDNAESEDVAEAIAALRAGAPVATIGGGGAPFVELRRVE